MSCSYFCAWRSLQLTISRSTQNICCCCCFADCSHKGWLAGRNTHPHVCNHHGQCDSNANDAHIQEQHTAGFGVARTYISRFNAHCPCALPIANSHCLLSLAHCILLDAYCTLPVSYCLLPSACCIFPTALYYPLHIANFRLHSAQCLLHVAYFLLPTASCILPSSNAYRTHCTYCIYGPICTYCTYCTYRTICTYCTYPTVPYRTVLYCVLSMLGQLFQRFLHEYIYIYNVVYIYMIYFHIQLLRSFIGGAPCKGL